jgi:hypothetical protein
METTFGIIESEYFLGNDRGCLSKRTVLSEFIDAAHAACARHAMPRDHTT